MREIFEMIHDYATHPLSLVALIFLLIIYQAVSKRSRALPRIPAGLIILYLVLQTLGILLQPYDIGTWTQHLEVATTITLYCVVARFAVMVVMEIWLTRVHKITLPKITRDFVLALLFIVIVLWVLRAVGGINLTSLLTTSAILTAVIGLALQDTLGSFFAGLSLQIERPYLIGDWITCKGYEGKVVGINWRTTRIKTRFNEIVYIPNNEITKDVIKNFSQPEPTHIVEIEFGVEYGAPPNKVRKIALDVLNRHPRIVKQFKSTVRLMKFDDFSVSYKIYTKIDNLEGVYIIMAEIRNHLWYALRRNGVRIPFPIRDVNVRQVDEQREKDEQLAWIKQSLRRIPILNVLSDKDVEQLARGVKVEQYGIGEDIVQQGDVGDTMYLIQTGACDVAVEKPGARSQRVATLQPGNFFGEMSLLTGERRTATVLAKEDSIVLSIGRDAFQGMMETHPEISEGLAKALADRQAELDQIAKEKTVVERTTKTFLERIKGVFGLS